MAPDLTLDLRPPKPSFPNFLSKFLVTDFIEFNDDITTNDFDVFVVNDYIHRLDDELKKIQAFQRELPLSFLLLHDVIRKLKEATKEKNEEKELHKNVTGVNSGIEEFEKKTWLSSPNMCSPIKEQGVYEPPHKGAKMSCPMTVDDDVPGLSLVPPGLKFNRVDEPGSGRAGATEFYSGSVYFTKIDKNGKPGIKIPYQTTRKLRRRWSPELHRRFEDALEKLGGSKVATPKQIRDLMQVDGLTNNEVKSHLQKYRLHVRKLPAASTTTRLSSDLDGIDELELGCSTQDLQHSSSPKGPFHTGMSKKCSSSSAEEDEEEKSDGRSWKAHNDI